MQPCRVQAREPARRGESQWFGPHMHGRACTGPRPTARTPYPGKLTLAPTGPDARRFLGACAGQDSVAHGPWDKFWVWQRFHFGAGFAYGGDGVWGATLVLLTSLQVPQLAFWQVILFFVSPNEIGALLRQRCRQANRFPELKTARGCPARLVACRKRGLRAHGANSGFLNARIIRGG